VRVQTETELFLAMAGIKNGKYSDEEAQRCFMQSSISDNLAIFVAIRRATEATVPSVTARFT
jgi:hypothetical protein